MENIQQHSSTNSPDKTEPGPRNSQPGQQLPQNNETANENRFAETASSNEERIESSKPDAENQTLGTP